MTTRPAVRPRDLARPVVHSGDGFTVLTGDNVALAPEAVARAAGERLDAVGPGFPLLAFSRASRHGIAGLRGRVSAGRTDRF